MEIIHLLLIYILKENLIEVTGNAERTDARKFLKDQL
jgi:hypothetical protein